MVYPPNLITFLFVTESHPPKAVSVARDMQYFSGLKRPVWFVYSGMGSQWAGMATELMRIPVFAAAIEKSVPIDLPVCYFEKLSDLKHY